MAQLPIEQYRFLRKLRPLEQTGKSDTRDRWGVVLAGGDGVRLRPLTRRIAGDERPKQFCPILGGKTLLEQTRTRVALAITPDQTLEVVTHRHKPFYAPLLEHLPLKSVVVQPENRGTAPAILYSLLRIAVEAPMGSVAIFPSDHYVSNDEDFMAHVKVAFEAVQATPDLVVLLGIDPDGPEVQYGWIEPADSIPILGTRSICRIRRFWEKPRLEHAKSLLAQGCLWNSFVMVAHVPALLALLESALPELFQALSRLRPALGTRTEREAIESLYDRLPELNFSQEVLAKHPEKLAVLPVLGINWSDWGEPKRVMASLDRIGIRPQWAETEIAVSA